MKVSIVLSKTVVSNTRDVKIIKYLTVKASKAICAISGCYFVSYEKLYIIFPIPYHKIPQDAYFTWHFVRLSDGTEICEFGCWFHFVLLFYYECPLSTFLAFQLFGIEFPHYRMWTTLLEIINWFNKKSVKCVHMFAENKSNQRCHEFTIPTLMDIMIWYHTTHFLHSLADLSGVRLNIHVSLHIRVIKACISVK